MKREEPINDRVKIVIKDGQPPHPNRVHWLVVVDGYTVWHQTSNLVGPFIDMITVARYIARKEAQWL